MADLDMAALYQKKPPIKPAAITVRVAGIRYLYTAGIFALKYSQLITRQR